MQDLTGRTALVTGAAGGIGRALGRALARAGCRLVLVDRDGDALDGSADELGQDVLVAALDVTDPGALAALRAEVDERFGGVDVLCNNAGVGGRLGPTWELAEDDWDHVLGVNLRGVVNGIAAFVPGMVARGLGHVVNTASMAGLLPMPFGSPYVASKHAVVGLSANLRWELAQSAPGVSASVLCPGWVQTGIASGDDAGVLAGHAEGPAGVMAALLAENVSTGMSPDDVAERVVTAIREDEFWVLTHQDQAAAVLPHYRAAVRSAGIDGSRG